MVNVNSQIDVNSQKDVLALNKIVYVVHVNSLCYIKRLILYCMTLVLNVKLRLTVCMFVRPSFRDPFLLYILNPCCGDLK